MKETRTIKLWMDTYRALKVLAAQCGETLVVILDRLVREEIERRKEKP